MSYNLDELKGLVTALQADRDAEKEKLKRETWTKYGSLSMIVLAVLAAIATQRGGSYSSETIKQLNEATYFQALASDQWAYYQAKGIKQSISEEQEEQLKAALNPDQKRINDLVARITRYENEKKQTIGEAREVEAKRDLARVRATNSATVGRGIGLATTVFQIAIALGGTALVVRKRWLWYTSLTVGGVATFELLNALLRQ